MRGPALLYGAPEFLHSWKSNTRFGKVQYRRWAFSTYAESENRFRYAFAESLSANVAKERSDAEQLGEAVSR